jgi:hypothetical protein
MHVIGGFTDSQPAALLHHCMNDTAINYALRRLINFLEVRYSQYTYYGGI